MALRVSHGAATRPQFTGAQPLDSGEAPIQSTLGPAMSKSPTTWPFDAELTLGSAAPVSGPVLLAVLVGVGSVLLIAGGFLLWNRALTRKVEQRTAAYRRELAERKRSQKLQASRNVVLEQLARGRSLRQVLRTLIEGVEAVKPGMMGSILLLDDDNKCLRGAAAPSLPESYNKAIDGVKIGKNVGSCGAAAFTGRRVIAADIMDHPNWEAYRDLARKANLGSCWSEPIVSSSSQILGTLAMYYAEAREPTADDLELLKNTANLAGIAIQRSKTELALRASDAKLASYAAELEDRVAKRTRDLEAARDELLALNDRFRAAKDTAEVASLSKSEFLANMSHEIRSPMTAILGYAEIVYDEEKRTGAPSSRIEAIDTIRRNGKQLLAIINDILDLSKFEAGKMTVERELCSPVLIVNDVIDLMRVRADAKGLSLDTVYEGAIPATIESDATRLRQIMVNLIGNAIKFTERGGIRVTVRLVHPEGGPEPLLAFEVLDSGIGIDDAHMEELFQPFAQADASTTRKFGGTGLGLTISRRFAMLLGGDITVEGARGVGCTFTVSVGTGPLDAVRMVEPGSTLGYDIDADRTPAPEGEEPGPEDEFTLDGIRILLAEDTLDNQRLIMHHLRRWGAHLEIADDGRAAVESVLQAERNGDPFDLVLMDMQMPEMDGYEATRRLRESGFARPIIALTAHAMRGDRERCLAAGMDDYVSKPIEPSVLFTAIIQAVGRAMLDDFAGNGTADGITEAPPAPPEPPPPETIIDAAAALERAGGSPELLTELIDIFLGESSRRLADLHRAAGKGDVEEVHRTAHQIKGSVANFSAAAATEAAFRVERLAQEGDGADLDNALAALDREIARLRPELLALRDG